MMASLARMQKLADKFIPMVTEVFSTGEVLFQMLPNRLPTLVIVTAVTMLNIVTAVTMLNTSQMVSDFFQWNYKLVNELVKSFHFSAFQQYVSHTSVMEQRLQLKRFLHGPPKTFKP